MRFQPGWPLESVQSRSLSCKMLQIKTPRFLQRTIFVTCEEEPPAEEALLPSCVLSSCVHFASDKDTQAQRIKGSKICSFVPQVIIGTESAKKSPDVAHRGRKPLIRPSNCEAADYSDLHVVATPASLPLLPLFLPLLLPQRIGRVNLRNLQGWEDCGQQRHKHEGKHHGSQSWRIVDVYAVQHAAHHS